LDEEINWIVNAMATHKIAHLVTSDKGGAAAAAIRLHEGLLKSAQNSVLLVLHKYSSVERCYPVKIPAYKRWLFRVKNKIQFSRYKDTLHANKYFFRLHENLYSLSTKEILNSLPFVPDFFVVHWITGFIDFQQLYDLQIATGATIVFNHLDMSLITGGCHYSFGCKGYEDDCAACPAIHNSTIKDSASAQLKARQKYFPLKSISIVPSTLLDEQTAKSTLFRKTVSQKLLIGLDPNLYLPADKKALREKYGIPMSKRVVLFGAETITDERKGFVYMKKALEELSAEISQQKRTEIVLVLIGKHTIQDLGFEHISFEHIVVPYANSSAQLIEYYQLSDFFVCPSVEDSGPMMINEAMMCGLPVLAFDNGVARDLITQQTGYIVELNNVREFSAAIGRFASMEDEEMYGFQLAARKNALQCIDIENHVRKFTILMDQIAE